MKVCIIGGTGLLGSEAARELIARGHQVKAIALPPLPAGAVLPPEMEISYGNYMEMTDDQVKEMFEGCQGFVFAAGVDERLEGPPPIYELYKKHNIDSIDRLLRIAKETGVKHSVICGSYFSYFDKTRPELNLTKYHPYIRSRRDQEEVALKYAEEGFDVAILEIPYVFGTQPGRKPVWVFLVENIRSMEKTTMWPKGGTTMLTARQIGQAIAGALEKNKKGNCYPLGYYNLTWKEMLTIMHKYMGTPDKKIMSIPKWMFALGGKKLMKDYAKRNVEPGLHMVKFADLQCSNQFIDKSLGSEILGVTEDDIDAAIGESVKLSMDILDKKVKDVVDMKGE